MKPASEIHLYRPAMEIVEEHLVKEVPTELAFLKPKKRNLKRAINRHRQKMRPTEPTDLNFTVS